MLSASIQDLGSAMTSLKRRFQAGVAKGIKGVAPELARAHRQIVTEMSATLEFDDGVNKVAWAPTSKIAARNRKNPARGDSWQTLVDTGNLINSIQPEKITSNELIIQPKAPYALGMQVGTTLVLEDRTFDVPARPFMFATKRGASAFAEAVAEGIDNG